MAKAVIKIEGMSCNHCKMSVENALKTIEGVQNAVVDLGAKAVAIDFDPGTVNEMGLKKTISDAG
jgi:copper chaperone